MKIEINDEIVDQIIVEGLVNAMDNLKQAIDDLSCAKSGDDKRVIPYYDNDPVIDARYIQEDIESIRKVLDFYGALPPSRNAKA
jgi:hypothetical protein